MLAISDMVMVLNCGLDAAAAETSKYV